MIHDYSYMYRQNPRAKPGTAGLVALLLGFLSWCSSAQAEAFRIGVEEVSHFPQFGTVDGEYTGYAREVFDAFASDSGHQFEYVLLSVKRLMPALVSGRIDLRYPDNPKWYQAEKAELNIRYSRPLAVSLAGLNVPPHRIGIASPRSIGVPLGFNPIEFQREIDTGRLKLVSAPSMKNLVRMALHGRVDSVYGSPAVVQFLLRELGEGPESLMFDYSQPYSLHGFSISSIKHAELLATFDTWYRGNTDLVARLKAKHGLQY